MDWVDAFYHAKWQVTADQAISWREIAGNGFGLGSALDPAMETSAEAC